MSARLARLAEAWVYGGALMVPILLLMAPALLAGQSAGVVLSYLSLIAYLAHQYEEHDADRFRSFTNTVLAQGRAGLSHLDVLVINWAGVWLWLALTLVLSAAVSDGWATLALYLLGVNGLVHIGQAAALRRYNPGLVTSVALFLPLCAVFFAFLEASLAQHLVSLAAAIALHAVIIRRAFRPAEAAP